MFVSFKTPYVKAFGLINFGQIEGYIYRPAFLDLGQIFIYIYFIYIYIYLLILFISIHICVNEKRIYLFDG